MPLEEILEPQIADLPGERLEQVIETSAGLSAEDLEDFWDSLRKVGTAVSGVVKEVAPVAPILGTAIGTAIGGPAGAAIGGALGTAISGAYAPPSAQPAPQPSAPSPQPVASPPAPPAQWPPVQWPPAPWPGQIASPPRLPAPRPLPAPTGPALTAPAAVRLLHVLFRPETLQALMSMMMGPIGRKNVRVGNARVPTGAFASMLGTLASEAAAEFDANSLSTTRGRYDSGGLNGEGSDSPDPYDRALELFELLQEADVEQGPSYTRGRWRVAREDAPDYVDQISEAIDLAEVMTKNALR